MKRLIKIISMPFILILTFVGAFGVVLSSVSYIALEWLEHTRGG